jgi:hypothetical protein
LHYKEVNGLHHAPDSITLGKEPLPRYKSNEILGGPQSRSKRCGLEKILVATGNPTPALQSIAHRYTDCAIPDTHDVRKRQIISYTSITVYN